MLTLLESRYTLKGRYNIGNVGKTASMSMLTLLESRYTLKGRYNIGNVGKTASMSMLTLFESRYMIQQQCVKFVHQTYIKDYTHNDLDIISLFLKETAHRIII